VHGPGPHAEVSLTRRKQVFFVGFSFLTVVLVLAAVSEVALRAAGIGPWNPKDKQVRIEPGGTFFVKHPTLGYTHIPGSFDVTLEDGYSFHVTHLPDTHRITHPLDTYTTASTKSEIWIFGCSFTHGWAVNDDQTYPWLLQEEFPDYEVVNFACSGYGTLHALLQFRDAIKTRQPPAVAVLAYASFHDARNTFLRKRAKSVATWNKLGPLEQPYARLDENGNLQIAMADVVYREFPLMRRSALAHFVEITYDNYEAWRTPSRRITEALIEEIAALADSNGVQLVFAFIDGYPYMMDFTRRVGIPTVDISVDLSLPENNNLPHDGHPSAHAHRQYADKLAPILRETLTSTTAKP
jgi:hypothetical protein